MTELLPHEVRWQVGDLDSWLSSLPAPAASAVANAIEDGSARVDDSLLAIPAATVASWPDVAAMALGLPAATPLGFDMRLNGAIGKPGATVVARWLKPGKTVAEREAVREGLWLRRGTDTWRIPSPLFDVLALAEQFNAAAGRLPEEQFRLWARMRELLGEKASGELTDGFLRSFRVATANALTFAITADSSGQIQLEPVLLASRRAAEGEGVEHVRALTEEDERVFVNRLDQLHEGALAFPIAQGTYVIVDEALQKALAAVRRLRQAPPEQRKRAAMYPEAVLRDMLDAPDDASTPFVETERFAERVRDVGEWSAPVLPWIKIAPQQWDGPGQCGVRVNGVDVPLQDRTELAAAVESMRAAIKDGKRAVPVAGNEVPATAANLAALERLLRAMDRRDAGAGSAVEDEQGPAQVLIIETNFDETSYRRTSVGVRKGRPELPPGLRTRPKPHQEVGIHWLQRHWVDGSRGVLLCDDMGLGKTFQALAFCRWLRELMARGDIERRPLLVVAPVGLLKNWEAEIGDHLEAPGLGSLVRAYGEHIRALKRGRHLDGNAGLDTAALARADVVLANYEAVSEYQLSFGAVRFCAVVLDEAQKIKSPSARVTHAVKALNAEFVVAMTGTPVENRLADLWCIADAVQPGALADLRDFSARYERTGADVGALREVVWHEEADVEGPPRMLLRRLKTDKLEGLPPKNEHVIRVPMPQRQAEAYGRALAERELSGPEGTLGMIHALRRVSLHPLLLEGGAGSGELRVEDSARMQAAIDALDRIAEIEEKALVFLESLDLQEADQLPLLLKRRYGLRRLPMVINGQVSTEDRQARVRAFQSETGFDVMLLSPKAGGVGLTLTAANHVIHLSRWWNPAVEDQCSDRVYRIGQTRPVHIYYPLAVLPDEPDHSFDVQLQQLMDRKRALARDLLAPPAFTREDYEELLAGSRAPRPAGGAVQ
jgi:hypothetical protein